jgi:hypothetical protein
VTGAREGRHAVEGERIAMVGGRVMAMTGLQGPDLWTWYLKPFYFFCGRVRPPLF